MFSFGETGRPIARVDGGEYNNLVLRIYDKSEENGGKCCVKCSDKCLDGKKCCQHCQVKLGGCCSGKTADMEVRDVMSLLNEDQIRGKGKGTSNKKTKLSVNQMKLIISALQKQQEPEQQELKEAYKAAAEQLKEKASKEIHLQSGKFLPMPNPKTNIGERGYITGSAGAGKSYWVSMYIQEYMKMFPKNRVIIFSRLEKDPSLDHIKKIKRIIIDDELVEKPIQPKELRKSLVVFDDTDTGFSKEISDALQKLKDDVMQTGRHEKIYVLITSHVATNYKETRKILSDISFVVFYPQSGSLMGVTYFMKKYLSLSQAQVNKILAMPSRWIMINRNYPNYILTENECILISAL